VTASMMTGLLTGFFLCALASFIPALRYNVVTEDYDLVAFLPMLCFFLASFLHQFPWDLRYLSPATLAG
jgi:hypothetical protein